MANLAKIITTIFTDSISEEKSKGVRVFDDYGQGYDNTWEDIPDDDFEILQKVIDNENPAISEIIIFMMESESGCSINGEFYGWDDIKHLFE